MRLRPFLKLTVYFRLRILVAVWQKEDNALVNSESLTANEYNSPLLSSMGVFKPHNLLYLMQTSTTIPEHLYHEDNTKICHIPQTESGCVGHCICDINNFLGHKCKLKSSRYTNIKLIIFPIVQGQVQDLKTRLYKSSMSLPLWPRLINQFPYKIFRQITGENGFVNFVSYKVMFIGLGHQHIIHM